MTERVEEAFRHRGPKPRGAGQRIPDPPRRSRTPLDRLGLTSIDREHALLEVSPHRYPPVPGVRVGPRHRLRILDAGARLVGGPESPLHAVGVFDADMLATARELHQTLEGRWWSLVDDTDRALRRARCLAPRLEVGLGPWRIEGETDLDGRWIRLLFSRRGDRAVVVGADGRRLPPSGWVLRSAAGWRPEDRDRIRGYLGHYLGPARPT